MKLNKTLDQHIAVFGESGSGKTVLLSSFYGWAQEPQFLRASPYHIVADNIGLGNILHKNYLQMRDVEKVPEASRYKAIPYSFSIKMKNMGIAKDRPFDALRLVWHDYPGEWFEQDPSGPEEAQRRVDTFRALLGADVAFVLIDGQKILDHSGEEERYLKSWLGNLRNGILSLKNDLLPGGKPLIEFPRIWIIALSKCDLLPDYTVFTFRDLMIKACAEEIALLKEVIASLVVGKDALAVGEDFMLLSSAKFNPGKIDVTKRVGLDLILPLAAMLPFERHIAWAKAKTLPVKVAQDLLRSADALARVLVKTKILDRLPAPFNAAVKVAIPAVLEAAVQLAGQPLQAAHAAAVADRDNLAATLTGFKMDLQRGKDDQTFFEF